MADERSTYETRQTMVGWMALLLSIISLILAWAAYNRAGRDLGQQAVDQTVNVQQEIRQQVAIAEARARLSILQGRINAGLNREEAAREVTSIRNDLRDTFQNVTGEARANWQRIDTDLGRLETGVRQGSADALQTLENVVRELKNAVSTDEDRMR